MTGARRRSLWVGAIGHNEALSAEDLTTVLEYMPGGQIEWTKDDEPLMTVDESRRVFRDVVLGLEYRQSDIIGCDARG